ncbi:MAG: PaaI family thioesterase [Gammaproteobacteria bacterium]|jgi:uncharacterized protein (TIGR00369 family)|nr:PaaI family thioesterase [Gammaproteobacteria bacterium]MBT4491795.1 PaaI family thioesterase [Gammaproteobacteria bacterium]MBT7370674.1 PaaI family thioesterase [Gammaproteobacteria bacterium]
MSDLASTIPAFGQAIGLEYRDTVDGMVTLCVPYAEHLIGDPDTGVIHGGVITAALDNGSGWAVRVTEGWDLDMAMATLDLRIDYMKPSAPGEDLLIRAECYKRTKNIAFIRAVAYNSDPEDPVATSVAAFMLGTLNQPRV